MNPFSHYISSTNLKTLIMSKTFSQDQSISSTSMAILDKVNVESSDFNMEIWLIIFDSYDVLSFNFFLVRRYSGFSLNNHFILL